MELIVTQIERLNRLKDFVQAALPDNKVLGLENEGAAPDRVPSEGRTVLRRGDPGDPQVDLNPLTYWYEHQIPFQVTAIGDPNRELGPADVAAEILAAVSTAIKADRTAGGAFDWLDATAPSYDDIYTSGAALTCHVEATLIASYSSTDPL